MSLAPEYQSESVDLARYGGANDSFDFDLIEPVGILSADFTRLTGLSCSSSYWPNMYSVVASSGSISGSQLVASIGICWGIAVLFIIAL